ncbi:MAG: hypothetical protein ACO1QR_11950 [Chthoniobacteraceae bacterium]
MDAENVTLQQWISHVFDHPVTKPEWHWAPDAPELDLLEPGHAAEFVDRLTAQFVAETFEAGGELLARFSDAQLNQGFNYLISAGFSGYMSALTNLRVPWPLRQRALRAIVPLFEQVMAVRCSSHLSHLDEQPANPLNAVCYMWWDIIPFDARRDDPDFAEFDQEVLSVLRRLLAIPHDACRESALHGLGHWQLEYPEAAAEIIDEFLAHSRNLRPELVAYAEQARIGCIQ